MSTSARALVAALGLVVVSTLEAAPDASIRVFELVQAGQLDAARHASETVVGTARRDALRRVIDQRADVARRLLERARRAVAQDDLTAARRAIESALAIDVSLASDALVDEHRLRQAQVDAEISRASTCAAQRKFDCVSAAVDAARQLDRHSPAAAFWAFYANDWRPAR